MNFRTVSPFQKRCGTLSVAIALAQFLLYVNRLLDLVPIPSIQGLPILLPILVAPIGMVLGFVAIRNVKNKRGTIGIALNILMFLLSIGYHVIGTLLEGP
jgi:hypothetical protein